MVVFDLDDTLYKEVDFVESGRRAIMSEYGDTPGFEIDGEWSEEMLQLYRNHKPEIVLDPDTHRALEVLKRAGVRVGVITDGRSITQRNKIEALGLTEYIAPDDIIISEEIGADKTSEVPFHIMMSRNPDEKEYVYIGDNPTKDFLQAKRLGWQTVMVVDQDGRNVHPQTLPGDTAYHPDITADCVLDYISKNINHLHKTLIRHA